MRLAVVLALLGLATEASARIDPAIRAALKAQRGLLHACVVKERERAPKKRVDAGLVLHVAPDGSVKRAVVTPKHWRGSSLEACVLQAARGLRFPKREGGGDLALRQSWGGRARR